MIYFFRINYFMFYYLLLVDSVYVCSDFYFTMSIVQLLYMMVKVLVSCIGIGCKDAVAV